MQLLIVNLQVVLKLKDALNKRSLGSKGGIVMFNNIYLVQRNNFIEMHSLKIHL